MRLHPPMICLLAALPAAAVHAAAPAGDTALTVYSAAAPGEVDPAAFADGAGVPGFGIVRQEREITLPAGRSSLRFTDVPARIEPTTVTFVSLTDPATRVLEQAYEFDLVSTDKLLRRYVDNRVTVQRFETPELSGTLLAAGEGLVLRTDDGSLTALQPGTYQSVRFGELPGGLITRPTLVWDLQAATAGAQRARVTYETGGLTWWTDYNLIFHPGKDANSGTVDLSAWVSLLNQSGATYTDARLKLVAGDVNRAPGPAARRSLRLTGTEMPMVAAADAGFTEQSFDEYHLYTLGRRTTLPDKSTKQIELFDRARAVPVRRRYEYTGIIGHSPRDDVPQTEASRGIAQGRTVASVLEFRNARAAGLGLPLPAGRVRVSRLDPRDGSLEFIGEDVIQHTPRDETVRLMLGKAFDVLAERRQRAFEVDTRARHMEEEIEVELRNHKDEPVEVQVLENLFRWNTANLLHATPAPQRPDARQLVFSVQVPAQGKATARYRVRYTW
ncbi:MAG: hypothetical protein RL026_925 [Pseudomonadota bacterium]|jgi:hypothetical protein